MASKSITLLDILVLLVRKRRLLIVNFIIAATFGIILSLIYPKWYRSYAKIFPPQPESSGINFSSFLTNLPLGKLGLNTVSDEVNTYLAILNSRSLIEKLIRQFNLQEIYKQENIEKTIKIVRSHLRFDLNEDGTVSISVEAGTGFFPVKAKEDSARHLAQRMTAFVVRELDRIYRDKRTEKAKFDRIYIEKRYKKNLADLKAAEEAYQKFQQRYGAFDLPEQIKAQISIVATLQAEILSKEVEVGVIRNYLTQNNDILRKAEKQLAELRKKLISLDKGDKNGFDQDLTSSQKLFLPFSELPEVGLDYLRLYRELEMQQKLLEFLLPQYEQAKIQEAKDTPVVQILDPASFPILKSRPKRAFVVIFIAFFAAFMTILYILFKDFQDRNAQLAPQKYRKIGYILNALSIRNLFRNDNDDI